MPLGRIVKLRPEEDFGFIDLGRDEQAYFKISTVPTAVGVFRRGDEVRCHLVETSEGLQAQIVEVIRNDRRLDVNPYLFFYSATLTTTGLIGVGLYIFIPISALLAYLLSVNIAGFILMGYDKSIARTSALRVPEDVVYAISFMGGSAGVLFAMKLFRHKTRKKAFQLTLILVLLVQFILLRIVSSSLLPND